MATKKKTSTGTGRERGELHRGQGTGRANAPKGELPPYTSKQVPLGTYSGNKKASPSKGETNRGSGVKKSNLVPIKDKNQSVDKSKLQSIKTKTSTVDKSKLQPIKTKTSTSNTSGGKKGEPIKTVTPEYRKSRLEPIKSVEKKPNKTKTKRK